METRKRTRCLLAALALGAVVLPASACGYGGVAELAVSENAKLREPAIASLRDAGPAGLETMLAAHATSIEALKRHLADPAATPYDPAWDRLRASIDAIAAQCDGFTSGLYWYTDLEQAVAAANDSGKPILSLRLLGRLDEDASCANSRYFRTALYANETIASTLREKFILHWESVRPVPRITIDFGDGRRIVRTITGNSAHYALDGKGRPMDVLPGLYGPGPFATWLERMSGLHQRVSAGEPRRAEILRRHHDRCYASVVRSWEADLQAVGSPPPQAGNAAPANARRLAGRRLDEMAIGAARIAPTKMAVELPMLAVMLPAAVRAELRSTTETWPRIAARHLDDARLDAGSILLMSSKTGGPPPPETIDRFEETIALDGIRNEYLLHRRVHEWFAGGWVADVDVAALNERVYAELFLSPADDPWMGLAPSDAYAALAGEGLIIR